MVATMYEKGGLKIVGVCDGPDESGCCPHAVWEALVPCAGLEIALSRDELVGVTDRPARRRYTAPDDLRVCPLSARGAFAALYAAREGYFGPFSPDGL